MSHWTLFSNYGHVLVCLARNNEARLRDVATDVGITERAVQKIVRELQDEGYITVRKQGRRNRYRINSRKGLRHSLESHCSVGKLLGVVKKPPTAAEKAAEKAILADPVEQEPFEPVAIVDESPEYVDYVPAETVLEVAPEPAPEPRVETYGDSFEDPLFTGEPAPPSEIEATNASSPDLPPSEEPDTVEEENDDTKRQGTPPIDVRQQRSLF